MEWVINILCLTIGAMLISGAALIFVYPLPPVEQAVLVLHAVIGLCFFVVVGQACVDRETEQLPATVLSGA